jgi:hypothetical protein
LNPTFSQNISINIFMKMLINIFWKKNQQFFVFLHHLRRPATVAARQPANRPATAAAVPPNQPGSRGRTQRRNLPQGSGGQGREEVEDGG